MNKDKSLPTVEQVIIKVKQMRELSPEEELVYLTQIEMMNEEEAFKMISERNREE